MVAMNTPDQNANAGVELVFATTMTSGSTASIIARRHRDFIQNMITGAASHGERVMAMRDKFMDVSDGEVSDKNGRLSRSMTVKAIRSEFGSAVWPARLCFSLCTQTLALRCTRSV